MLLAWMVAIFMLSHQPGADSTVTSNRVAVLIFRILDFVLGNIGMSEELFLVRYIPIIRKTAHFTEFAILGILIENVLRDYAGKNSVYFSLLTGFLYACSDEIHQLFIVNRYCSLNDVMIDSFGVLIGVVLCHFIIVKWIKKSF